jgi:hypothetical protein
VVQVRAQQREDRPVTFGKVKPGPAAEEQPHGLPRPGEPPGASWQAQSELMLDSRQADSVAVHAGGMPLPGRVEVRDLRDAAQVAGSVGIAAGVAGRVVVPELLRTSVPEDVIVIHWDVVYEPVLLPTAVDALDRAESWGRDEVPGSRG